MKKLLLLATLTLTTNAFAILFDGESQTFDNCSGYNGTDGACALVSTTSSTPTILVEDTEISLADERIVEELIVEANSDEVATTVTDAVAMELGTTSDVIMDIVLDLQLNEQEITIESIQNQL